MTEKQFLINHKFNVPQAELLRVIRHIREYAKSNEYELIESETTFESVCKTNIKVLAVARHVGFYLYLRYTYYRKDNTIVKDIIMHSEKLIE